VPQIFNLLYRRFAIGKAPGGRGQPAGYKPAKRQIENLRHILVAKGSVLQWVGSYYWLIRPAE
jgi:hypothetical protein